MRVAVYTLHLHTNRGLRRRVGALLFLAANVLEEGRAKLTGMAGYRFSSKVSGRLRSNAGRRAQFCSSNAFPRWNRASDWSNCRLTFTDNRYYAGQEYGDRRKKESHNMRAWWAQRDNLSKQIPLKAYFVRKPG